MFLSLFIRLITFSPSLIDQLSLRMELVEFWMVRRTINMSSQS